MLSKELRADWAKGIKSCRFWKMFLLIGLAGLILFVVLYLSVRFLTDRPVVYASNEDHFKYGSTGGERNWGFPYWIWRVAPEVCADLIPNRKPGDIGYEPFGMLYELGKDLPVGVSKRRHLGLDRVFLNCAACHSSTLRKTADGPPEVVVAMGANTFDLMGFQRFMFECGKQAKFNKHDLIATIEARGGKLDLLDRYLVYPIAIWITKDLLSLLESRFAFIDMQPPWGPGRVDTFNSAKAKFNFPWKRVSKEELIGTADFPSIWNQRPRKVAKMRLHWDGNNDKVEERNLSAAFGTGAIPPFADHQAIGRIEQWLLDYKPEKFPFPIDTVLAAKGQPIYQAYCAECHGADGENFDGAHVGQVTPIEQIGTDRWRLDSYTYALAVNQSTLYGGYPQYRFSHFRKTFGYANAPLDRIWLRAPYLHNGSVPTLRDLLEPVIQRPRLFYRGNDLYDPVRVGFVSDVAEENGHKYFPFDTTVAGNSNQGHEGKRYGTLLSSGEKDALVEYLKTF